MYRVVCYVQVGDRVHRVYSDELNAKEEANELLQALGRSGDVEQLVGGAWVHVDDVESAMCMMMRAEM